MRYLTALFLTLLFFTSNAFAQNRTISFQIEGAPNDTIHLAYYVGKKLFYKDTTMSDAQGRGSFSASKEMATGVYAVVVDNQHYFELLVNEPKIEMHSEKANMSGAVSVKTSEENKIFYEYISYLGEKRKEADAKRKIIKESDDPLRKFRFEKELETIDKEVKEYQRELVAKHKGKFVATLVNMNVSTELEQPKNPDGTIDSAAAYFQYRENFWNNIDLTQRGIVGTPVFHNKLEEYFSRTVPQIPDTINLLADELIAKIPAENTMVFRYVVNYLTHKYETSDVMGMDAVFAHMGSTYYCPDKDGNSRVDWMPEDKIEQLCERIRKLTPLLIGQKAPYLRLTDTTEVEWVSMYDLPAEYVVVMFWDPNCGACKKELPELKAVYDAELKAMGVEVFAVAKAVEPKDFKDWKTFIRESNLDWVNVGLTTTIYNEAKVNASKYIPEFTTLSSLNYSDTWDVYSTPKVFVIDKDRKIVAKQLAAEQIAGLIKNLQKRNATKVE